MGGVTDSLQIRPKLKFLWMDMDIFSKIILTFDWYSHLYTPTVLLG